ncbi:hypothetical protein BJY01DRAFT_238984 [Aspergillus pseudoustus]|uniref:Zn(2)-C6 fungal-type domain-containing protein n=1 Tax=Aspergillus pseudoustus TaxID=1810923 RepID=A0ABR4J5J2_9EURO
MSYRQFHHKSRHGCVQCKKNRTKCDEQKPQCGRCARIGAECSLMEQTGRDFFVDKQYPCPSSQGYNLPEISGTTGGQREEEDTFPDDERERLRLMHHYTLHTAKSVSDLTLPQAPSVWSQWAVELAFKNDFLLHGILSISALHLALCSKSDSRSPPQEKHNLLLSAIHHHAAGVALFRPHLNARITPQNRDAVFAFSCMVTLYALGIQQLSDCNRNPIARILQVLLLMRKSLYAVKSDHTIMAGSPWCALMMGLDELRMRSPPLLPDAIEGMLTTLLLRARRSPISTTSTPAVESHHRDVYLSAIQCLRDAFRFTLMHQHRRLTIVFFVVSSPAELWDLVADGEPFALAILANYAVMLFWVREHIWTAGWGEDTIRAVVRVLPVEWQECVSWARGQIQLCG